MAAASQNKILTTLRVPDFDKQHVKAWFVHLDAFFSLNGIVDTNTKYHFTASLISLPILDEVLQYDKRNEAYRPKCFGNYFSLKVAIIEYFSK